MRNGLTLCMPSCVYIICNKYANGMHRDAARRLHQVVLYCRVSHVLTVHRTAVTARSTVGLSVRRLSPPKKKLTTAQQHCVEMLCTALHQTWTQNMSRTRCDSFPAPSKVCVTPPVSTKFTFGQQHLVHNCCTWVHGNMADTTSLTDGHT